MEKSHRIDSFIPYKKIRKLKLTEDTGRKLKRVKTDTKHGQTLRIFKVEKRKRSRKSSLAHSKLPTPLKQEPIILIKEDD